MCVCVCVCVCVFVCLFVCVCFVERCVYESNEAHMIIPGCAKRAPPS